MSGKSKTRNHLRDRFNTAFCENVLPGMDELNKARVVVHDSMQAIKGAYVENKQNWGHFVKALLREMDYCFMHLPAVDTFIMVFDDYTRVPLAKSVEQTTRSARQNTGNGANDLRDFEITGLDDEIPDTYHAAVSDRHVWCRRIIAFCVKAWATDARFAPKIPPGKTLIVDGHYLNYGDLGDIPVHPDAPLMFTTQPNSDNNNQTDLSVRFCPDLAHTLGEGDLGLFHFMRKYAEILPVGQTFIVLSIDSDILYMCLKFLHTFSQFQSNILIRYWPGLTWCVAFNPYWTVAKMGPSDVKNQKWVDVGILKEQIEADPDLRCMNPELRVPHVVVAANASGNDYVDNFPGVVGERFVDSAFKDAQWLGPLVRFASNGDWDLDGAAYVRLVDYACRRAGTRNKDWKAVPGENCGPGVDPAKRMPKLNDVTFRKYHTRFWLNMMNAIGEDDWIEPPLGDYGYGLKNKSKGPRYGNLVRLHGDNDNFESWDNQPRRPVMALPDTSSEEASASASASESASKSLWQKLAPVNKSNTEPEAAAEQEEDVTSTPYQSCESESDHDQSEEDQEEEMPEAAPSVALSWLDDPDFFDL